MATQRTTAEGLAQRERILRAATELFAAQGFRGASLDAVAAAVGMTRQGVLHYFPNKSLLLLGVLELRDEDETARAEGRSGDLLEQLQSVVGHNQTEPQLARLYTVLAAESLDPEHPGHEFFRARYRRLRELLGDAVAGAQAAGQVRGDVAPEQLAALIGAVMDGLQVQFSLDADEADMVALFAAFVRLLA